MPSFKKIIISLILKLITDQLIPPLTLFSLILALILAANFKTPRSLTSPDSSKVLGVEEVTKNCQIGNCGSCQNCGGKNGLTCGQLARCVGKENTFSCKFDLNCF